MLLTITTTHEPATNLGYILHKHPAKVQRFALGSGEAHVFFPEVTASRCTAALVVETNMLRLRNQRRAHDEQIEYNTDTSYVAGSLMSVAIAQVFGSALNGHCEAHPEMLQQAMPIEAVISVVYANDAELIHALFEPLGYTLAITSHLLDEHFPEWGTSPYFTVKLSKIGYVQQLLEHLYVLLPVLQNRKHYWSNKGEVEKLLRHGKGWLEEHPQRTLILDRYLERKRELIDMVREQLLGVSAEETQEVPHRYRLHDRRLHTLAKIIHTSQAKRVLDIGCGTGQLVKILLQDGAIEHVTGMDVAYNTLERAKKALHIDTLSERARERITLFHGSLLYYDARLEGYDLAVLSEVIEHIESERLISCEEVVFRHAHSRIILVTTPNAEYNTLYPTLKSGTFRHEDHRFEWTRAEFSHWVEHICETFGYTSVVRGIGDEDAEAGAPSHLGVFLRKDEAQDTLTKMLRESELAS